MFMKKVTVNLPRKGRIGSGDKIRMGQRRYTAEYRANAVALASEIDSSAASRQLEIPADTLLYTWVSRAKHGTLSMLPTPPDPKASPNLAERE